MKFELSLTPCVIDAKDYRVAELIRLGFVDADLDVSHFLYNGDPDDTSYFESFNNPEIEISSIEELDELQRKFNCGLTIFNGMIDINFTICDLDKFEDD